MTRDAPTVLLVVALVAAMVVAPVAAATQEDTPTDTPAEDQAVQPGEQLSGVVGVQEAEIDGEVEERTFGVQVARADSNASKARVVGEQADDVEARLAELEQRRAELREARDNGSISEGRYRAETAEVAARTATLGRLANDSEAVAEGLPEDVLAAQGVNVTAIRTLQDRAANLSGGEVAAVARSIAGDDVGRSAGADRGAPDDVPGAPDDPGNETGRGPGNETDTGDGRAPDQGDDTTDSRDAGEAVRRADEGGGY